MATIFTGFIPAKVEGAQGRRRTAKSPRTKGKISAAVTRDVKDAEIGNVAEPNSSFEADAIAILGPLQGSLGAIVQAIPGSISRSTDLQRVLGTDTKLAWQIFKFIHAPEVFPASSALPGYVAMLRF